ncbi:alpha/beta hydrolase [Auraticoccus monumenti]|uniref:Acetyl esterase/lipase n=1 Tax=Auraticoccus monumenti TaxID=675864 RepID=A0A1G7ETP3_9ACTN|nr:prolyl oligopeptidase family serine peptidase [Auraticoccus monumenti]SDE67070.1 Acetyl esterase/lipase [Auraticoccus monumenti]
MSPRDHVLVLPGGAYAERAEHEGAPVAEWLRGLGVGASVLDYPVLTRHPEPLRSVRAAVAAARADGAERVGVLGFSAGAHAAGMAAYAPGAAAGERPDLALLCYPVVSMQLATHAGSRENLIGPVADDALRASTSLDRLVTADAPPTFVWHTAADEAVPVEHAYLLGQALAAAGVPHELHVFPDGLHGIGLAADEPGADAWTSLAGAWLSRVR